MRTAVCIFLMWCSISFLMVTAAESIVNFNEFRWTPLFGASLIFSQLAIATRSLPND